MSILETNIFPITNLDELSSQYRLYQIRGLKKDEYDLNTQNIIKKLSFDLESPVTVISKDEIPHLVLRDDAPDPPDELALVRTVVMFEPTDKVVTLDYKNPTVETVKICLRFLNFAIQGYLNHRRRDLWQAVSGRPFFNKKHIVASPNIAVHPGFSVRVVDTPDNGFGLCVDVTQKYISIYPLPLYLTHDQFEKFKKQNCVYHYGHRWFEIKLLELSDLNVRERKYPKNGNVVRLLDDIKEETRKPWPVELANLPEDSSAALYKNNKGEDRSAPTGLCYPTYDTEDERVAKLHKKSKLPPHIRRRRISEVVKTYLTDLKFGKERINIDTRPLTAPQKMFQVPDLEFGNNHILSVRGTEGAQHVSLDKLGESRLELLMDPEAGPYATDSLARQYIILPESIASNMGTAFLENLGNAVDQLYARGGRYEPILITYNDQGPKNFLAQGRAILEAVDSEEREPGFGVVMIHHTTDRPKRSHDQLGAMVIRELRKKSIYTAIIHSEVAQECYELDEEDKRYRPVRDRKGKLTGYVRNVALNKILLTNELWPFVLATPLNADLTIGIDVKEHTAGYIFVGKYGKMIRPEDQTTSQKESLSSDQIYDMFYKVIKEEANTVTEYTIERIVVQRDGILYKREQKGILKAIDALKSDQVLPFSADVTILEIPKSTAAPFRLFETYEKGKGKDWVENPQVGHYYIQDNTDGYVCATGRAFPRPGTVRPLCVRYVCGSMPFEQALEDVYCLTVLAWTRPEDCSRTPITTKINDRRLEEAAAEYNEEAVEYSDNKTVEVVNE